MNPRSRQRGDSSKRSSDLAPLEGLTVRAPTRSSRRGFLKAAALGIGFSCLLELAPDRARAAVRPTAESATDFTVTAVERTTLRVPYRPAPKRAMDRELPHWRYTEIFEVSLRSGKTGLGETLLYYTWGVSKDEDVRRAIGGNALSLMWDDSLGAGLQMALFDAVGKTAGVPVHRLLGKKVHEKTPLSWWNIDMAPEDLASECAEALRKGYLSYKTKGRPWYDIWEQLDRATKVVPEKFKIDMDFNDTLRDAERAIPILRDLEKYPQIDIYETPIPQSDVDGNRRIREATKIAIALHYGTPSPRVVVEKGCLLYTSPSPRDPE